MARAKKTTRKKVGKKSATRGKKSATRKGRTSRKATAKKGAVSKGGELETMSLAQLRRLRGRIDERIAEAEREEVARLRAEFEEKAAKLGLAAADVIGQPKRRRAAAKRKVAKKRSRKQGKVYVNPVDASKTWSGRGRRPRWINDFIAAGGELETLRQ